MACWGHRLYRPAGALDESGGQPAGGKDTRGGEQAPAPPPIVPAKGTAAVPAQVIAPAGLPRAASLIGRAGALAELMAKLRAGDTVGVFAVQGMGGIGKTALAAEVVAQLAEDQSAFPGGAAWIACEGLEGETGVGGGGETRVSTYYNSF